MVVDHGCHLHPVPSVELLVVVKTVAVVEMVLVMEVADVVFVLEVMVEVAVDLVLLLPLWVSAVRSSEVHVDFST